METPLNDKEANVGLSDSNAGLAAVHCPNCPDQGWYEYETGGIDMDGENDTRECYQEQCQFCYETPNSVFNIACAAEAANALGEGRERGILREASSGEAATSTAGLAGNEQEKRNA